MPNRAFSSSLLQLLRKILKIAVRSCKLKVIWQMICFCNRWDNHLFIVITSSALGTGPVRFSTRQTTHSSFPSTSNVLPVVIFLSLHFLFPDMPLNLALSSFFPRLRTAPLTELGRGMEQGSTSTFPSAPPMRG